MLLTVPPGDPVGELPRAEYRVAQGQLIARIAREKLYAHHKNRYAALRKYLKAAGLGDSLVSDLVMVGVLVGFCDQHRIKIDQNLTSKQWPKLCEAIPALRRKVKTGDVKGVRAILRDVKRLSTREAVRAKFRRSWPKLGRGVTIQSTELMPNHSNRVFRDGSTTAIIRRNCAGRCGK